MTVIKDIFSTHEGIFHDLKQANEETFIEYFGNIDTDILEVMFIAKAASKTVSPIVETMVCEDAQGNKYIESDSRHILALTIWASYGYQWQKTFEALMNDYNAMNPSDYTVTTTEQYTGTNNNTDTNSDVNKVYGFDSDTSVNDNEGNMINTSEGRSTSSRTTTVSKTGKDGGYTYGTLLDNALKAAKNSFNSIAVSNVVNFTTTDIYE